MIEIKNISKHFSEKVALNNVNITLNEGEVIALVGENGAGKSTLMRLMCGYIKATSGNILIYGTDIEKEHIKALSFIGYVPEISVLYSDMTVYDFLTWIAGIWNIKNKNSQILKVAKQMQIMEVLAEKTENLSKGFKKRVEIASALLHEPKLLILDEPTDGLDPNQKHVIREFIKQYAKKNIVLISTHVLEDADAANRVIMLAKGNVICDTSISVFKKNSQNKDIGEAFRILSQRTKGKK